MTFWILISLMALLVAAFLLLALLRGRPQLEPAAASDLRVYREQLQGVDRDLARGVIAEADASRIRTEISRRILAADAQIQSDSKVKTQARAVNIGVSLVLVAGVIGGALSLYQSLGAPGYGDLPLSLRLERSKDLRANRLDQSTAEARMPAAPVPELPEDYANLVKQLRQTVAERPDDLQGHVLLAQHEANVGNPKGAYEAKARVITLLGPKATSQDFSEFGEMMIVAAGGYVSAEAEQALARALEIDPNNGPARFYWGRMLSQIDRPDLAFRLWSQTLQQGPAGAPWIAAIRAQIEELAHRAGVDYELPPETPHQTAPDVGPSRDDIEAAGEMTDSERQEMIQGMVNRLSDRLATEGGTPPEWARLIGALAVLGNTEQAAAIYGEAQSVFANSPEALNIVQQAAKQAGVAP
ncbi:c-type cytochrome biogenesis protein CcmI [Falsiruegeria litorea]|uniref:c-type cytochrome biogenesis protein CcmI n=1 Tax=Falsiruegeria litorea TaxID=1280831 RepID=UPI001BFD3E9F|nr:c-type cytochrome biogenesis protein CcmI [Falsiruegeria litorea]MBT8170266.1 c-type cytochrome biogenesis protein CcmI [Falsiruegeria litorea]